ncbi:MAG: ThiF family adenylyltransferase [Armatimonas sp.]
MAESTFQIYPEHRAAFEASLRQLGFVKEETEEPGVCHWSGRVRATWRDAAIQKPRARTHQIGIVLKQGFPFQKPDVIPEDTDPPISGERHQAAGMNGALCLYPDEGRGWEPGCTAEELVERVRQWLVRYHNGAWAAEDFAPDLHLYFSANGKSCLMAYGEDWSPPQGQQFGRFGVWQVVHERAFAGNPTVGHEEPSLSHTDRLLPLLGLGNVPRNRVGLWFRLKKEPTPADTFGEMLREIDFCVGWEQGSARRHVRTLMGNRVPNRQSCLTIALGYPAPSGEEQWLFIQVWMRASGKKPRSYQSYDELPVRAFVTAPATESALMRRTGHTAKYLQSKHVILFGVGAIGSSVAMLLAKAGIETITLVDNDVIRPGNAVRNEAGMAHVGRSKTHSVGFEIWQHAPDCAIHCEPASWDPDKLLHLVERANIIIDTTANEAFSRLLNHICAKANKTAIFATSHRSAAIGRVRIIRPRRDACLECYEECLEQSSYPKIPKGDEGAFVEGGCGVPTVEASAIDVEAIANAAARAALHFMTGKLGDQNECIIVNEPLADGPDIFLERGTKWFQRSPVTDCVECSKTH